MSKFLLLFLIASPSLTFCQDDKGGQEIIENEAHWKPCPYDTLIVDSLVLDAKQKPILLFFYAVTSVNCLKFLEYSGFDMALQRQIELYFYPVLMQVDKPERIPEIRNPYVNGSRKLITYGSRFLEFQNELLKTQIQPTFAVWNKKGELIASIQLNKNHSNSREMFENFLMTSYQSIYRN